MSIGEIIASLRTVRCITQSDLSKKANVAQSTISDLESKKCKNPSVEVISKIALAFGMTVVDLLNYQISN